MDYNKQLREAAKAEKEDLERVQRLIQSRADVNAVDGDGYTPLHWAPYRGRYDICTTLLEHGARINKESKNNFTPLSVAIWNNREKIVRLLLEKGANPNGKAGTNDTALGCAIVRNSTAGIIDLLIEHGADPSISNGIGKKTPLHLACENRRKKSVNCYFTRERGWKLGMTITRNPWTLPRTRATKK